MAIQNSNEYGLNDLLITSHNPKRQISLASLVDNINNNNLHFFYQKDDNASFISKLDQLNLTFYLETEKYLSNPSINTQRHGDALVILLIQQINLYIEEIERLNLLFAEKKEDVIVLRNNDIEVKHKRGLSDDKRISMITLNKTNKDLEQKIAQLTKNEKTIRLENSALKRHNYQLMVNTIKANNNDENNYDPNGQYYNLHHCKNEGSGGELIGDNMTCSGMKMPRFFNKKRHYSEHNPYSTNGSSNKPSANDLVLSKGHNRLVISSNYSINTSNVFNNNSIEQNANKIINNNSRMHIKKKDFKIIKAVKEQLISDAKGKKISSPIKAVASASSPSKGRDDYKGELLRIRNDLRDIETVEDFLKKMKLEMLNENDSYNDSDTIIQMNNLAYNDYVGSDIEKNEVIVSSYIDDYSLNANSQCGDVEQRLLTGTTANTSCNGGNDKDKHKHFSPLNSVTINLNIPANQDNNTKEISDFLCNNKQPKTILNKSKKGS